jgi:hypothetical protein
MNTTQEQEESNKLLSPKTGAEAGNAGYLRSDAYASD